VRRVLLRARSLTLLTGRSGIRSLPKGGLCKFGVGSSIRILLTLVAIRRRVQNCARGGNSLKREGLGKAGER
jgi:hypothetical protein